MVLLDKIDEGFIFYHVLQFLKIHRWRVIGGEPPDGTSDDVPRIVIRDAKGLGRTHSKNTQKVDLMAFKSKVLLLIELKPSFDLPDKGKLDNLVENRISDVFDAIEERTDFPHRIIIVDNCSIQENKDFIEDLKKNGRIWKAVYNEKNLPLSQAFKKGFELVESE